MQNLHINILKWVLAAKKYVKFQKVVYFYSIFPVIYTFPNI